jgi:hypothetical protein
LTIFAIIPTQPPRYYYIVPLLFFLLAFIVAQRQSTPHLVTMSKADKRNKFLAVFEQIREDLITHFKSEKMPEDAVTWFNEVRIPCP